MPNTPAAATLRPTAPNFDAQAHEPRVLGDTHQTPAARQDRTLAFPSTRSSPPPNTPSPPAGTPSTPATPAPAPNCGGSKATAPSS
ncbi:hypothetical protein [Streptomyces sp. NBC_00470]|uniref:hypothetical protein n=1 Tax=Streptomyces sp. NBC_00470 TaxID=2975753 RepID=UPI002F90E55C